MEKPMNQMFCDTHKCQISITGCMLRQQRNQDNPPAWMYNKIPGDPKCSDCAQGKAVMKKYKHLKTKLMAADDDTYEKNKRAAADRKEAFMATDTTLLDNGPAGIPADQEAGPESKETTSTEKANTFMETKSCSDVDCDFTCYINEADHYFYRSKNTKDGFEGVCKKCKTEKAKARRHAKKTNKQGKPASSKPKQKKNPEKKAAASPETPVEKVVAPDMQEKGSSEYKKWIGRVWSMQKKTPSKKNNHPVDSDEMVTDEIDRIMKKLLENLSSHNLDRLIRQLFAGTYPPGLYDSLVQSAYLDTRPIHMQLVFLVKCQLEERGLV